MPWLIATGSERASAATGMVIRIIGGTVIKIIAGIAIRMGVGIAIKTIDDIAAFQCGLAHLLVFGVRRVLTTRRLTPLILFLCIRRRLLSLNVQSHRFTLSKPCRKLLLQPKILSIIGITAPTYKLIILTLKIAPVVGKEWRRSHKIRVNNNLFQSQSLRHFGAFCYLYLAVHSHCLLLGFV